MTSGEPAMLLLKEGPSGHNQWRLNKDEITLGREQDCDIVLDDRQVSRRHACIRRQGDSYILEDLHSKNGTFISDQPIEAPTELKDGDEITVALSFRLIFIGPDSTKPLLLEDEAGPSLRLDPEAKRVWVRGQELDPPLSLAQYRLLALLYETPGRVRSREEVVQVVWADEEAEGVSEQAIDALARRLRERIAEVDPTNQYIVTVRGHGFRLDHAVTD
jgi:pSer/pThr/pTyr-binding forkhead associated (FHA) protein